VLLWVHVLVLDTDVTLVWSLNIFCTGIDPCAAFALLLLLGHLTGMSKDLKFTDELYFVNTPFAAAGQRTPMKCIPEVWS